MQVPKAGHLDTAFVKSLSHPVSSSASSLNLDSIACQESNVTVETSLADLRHSQVTFLGMCGLRQLYHKYCSEQWNLRFSLSPCKSCTNPAGGTWMTRDLYCSGLALSSA